MPATLDPATGSITCMVAGQDFDGDVRAEWHPDPVEDSGGAEEAADWDGGDAAARSSRQSGAMVADARRQDDPRVASIPPTRPRDDPGGTWPGSGRGEARSTWPFGKIAQAASKAAPNAGLATGTASAAPREKSMGAK